MSNQLGTRKKFVSQFDADKAAKLKAKDEFQRHRVASVLAQIDLASCFHGEQEPLFALLSNNIYNHLKA